MIRCIGSILSVLALTAVCAASNCHVQRVVVQQHYVAPVVAVQQYYPAYSIGYTPAGELAEAVKLLIEDNRQMRSELIQAYKANIGGGPIPLKAEALKHPAAQASCVTCHDASVSKAKGDGFTFYKDGILLDTPENVGRMVEAVTEKGTMPRGVKWGAQEKLDFLRSVVVRTGAK